MHPDVYLPQVQEGQGVCDIQLDILGLKVYKQCSDTYQVHLNGRRG